MIKGDWTIYNTFILMKVGNEVFYNEFLGSFSSLKNCYKFIIMDERLPLSTFKFYKRHYDKSICGDTIDIMNKVSDKELEVCSKAAFDRFKHYMNDGDKFDCLKDLDIFLSGVSIHIIIRKEVVNNGLSDMPF